MTNLWELGKSAVARINSMPEQNNLKNLGILVGKQIKVFSKEPFGGPVVFEINGRKLALSKEVAEHIYVEECA